MSGTNRRRRHSRTPLQHRHRHGHSPTKAAHRLGTPGVDATDLLRHPHRLQVQQPVEHPELSRSDTVPTSIVIIEGNTGTDVRVHSNGDGEISVADVIVIVGRRTKNRDGQWRDATPTSHRVVAYGTLASNLAASIGKGDRILIVGHIVTDTWQDATTSDTRTADKVVADAIGPSLRSATARPSRAHSRAIES